MDIFMGIIIVVLIYVIITYNSLVKMKSNVEQAASGIDVYLTQRFDLIPNLVECVKGYMTHEQHAFEQIAKKRAKYLKTKNIKEGEELNTECNRIIALAENYPELKASEHFLNLQKNLAKIESQLQAARRIYNVEVNVYNNKVKRIPSNIVARIFDFYEEKFYEAEEEKRDNIDVDY